MGYQTASSKDSLTDEENMIVHGAHIPSEESDKEFNFDDIFAASQEELMSALDPETTAALKERQQRLEEEQDARSRRKKLNAIQKQKSKPVKKQAHLNKKTEKVGHMFFETFFAGLGDIDEMSIAETIQFNRKHGLHISNKGTEKT